MRLLAIESSTEYCSVALSVGDDRVERVENAGQNHSERMFPMIAQVLADSGSSLQSLDAIAFGAGPGSFTGLRIACGVAQGLGFALGIPLVPVGTLEALGRAGSGTHVLTVLDARMGELYLAAFEILADGTRTMIEPALHRPDELPDLPAGSWQGLGSGFAAHADALARRYAGLLSEVDAAAFPRASQVLSIGASILRAGGGVSAERAAPLYVRDKVALTSAERLARVR